MRPFRIRTVCYPFLYPPHHMVPYTENVFHGCSLNEQMTKQLWKNEEKEWGDRQKDRNGEKKRKKTNCIESNEHIKLTDKNQKIWRSAQANPAWLTKNSQVSWVLCEGKQKVTVPRFSSHPLTISLTADPILQLRKQKKRYLFRLKIQFIQLPDSDSLLQICNSRIW